MYLTSLRRLSRKLGVGGPRTKGEWDQPCSVSSNGEDAEELMGGDEEISVSGDDSAESANVGTTLRVLGP